DRGQALRLLSHAPGVPIGGNQRSIRDLGTAHQDARVPPRAVGPQTQPSADGCRDHRAGTPAPDATGPYAGAAALWRALALGRDWPAFGAERQRGVSGQGSGAGHLLWGIQIVG